MGKRTYKYKGDSTVHIPYVGTFEPGETKEVERRIDNPDFEELKKENKSK